jgi:type III pantothenate kinase
LKLAIDIGNTRTKLAWFKDGKIEHLETVSGVPSSASLRDLLHAFPTTHLAVASTSTDASEVIASWGLTVPTLAIDQRTPLPIQTTYHTPLTLGIDRLCGAVAARDRFPGQACLIIDMGSCITYDLIDADGVHRGGGISPGIKMRLRAMHHFTERLPLVDCTAESLHIGTDTTSSLCFGAREGAMEEIRGMMSRFSAAHPSLHIILTGGDHSMFEQPVENPIFAAQNIVLEGIHRILLHNLNAE